MYNYSKTESEREEFLLTVKKVVKQIEIPVLIGYQIERLEDIKKALYTGAKQVVIPYVGLSELSLIHNNLLQLPPHFLLSKV